MKSVVVCFVLLFTVKVCSAGDGEYAVARIPASLLKKANAVIRNYNLTYQVHSTTRTVTIEHYVITILNEKGDDMAELSEGYDRYNRLESIEGILYDGAGRQLKRVKKKDIQDMSAVGDNNLIDDTRYKTHNFYCRAYPYTIEYTIETASSSTLFFPRWVPQSREGVAVEASSFVIKSPLEYGVRYKSFNYPGEPVQATVGKEKNLTWKVSSLPALWRESYSPKWHDIATVVITGPADFQIDDYKGNMQSWQDFGKFVYALKKDRDKLPESVKKDIQTITSGIADDKEKIRRIYAYMQKRTRYISIQLGIGGWQPFDAADVAVKGYGDCKGLSNFMYSLLKEAGINSYYTIIRAGRNENYLTTDFPSQQFNHVILCVPVQKDTVWLECTSQTLQAGYLSDFTCNRPALLVDEQGGKLVQTPVYRMQDNEQVRLVHAMLKEDGTLTVESNSKYTGIQQDDMHEMINGLSKDKVKERLHENFSFGTYDIDDFNFTQEEGSIPSIKEKLKIYVPNYATVTGKRLFIVPNVMTRSSTKLSADSARKTDICVNFEYRDIDSVEISLPKGYSIESLPPVVNVTTRFGNYSSSVKFADDKLYYYRKLECNSGRFPPSAYSELVNFYGAINKSDFGKVVLVKN